MFVPKNTIRDIYDDILGDTHTDQDVIDCYLVATDGYWSTENQFRVFGLLQDYRNITVNRLKKIVGIKEAERMWNTIYLDEMRKSYIEINSNRIKSIIKKPDIHVKAKVRCPSLQEIEKYLEDTDWRKTGTHYNKTEAVYSIYRKIIDGEYIVIAIPVSESFSDFSQRITGLIADLAGFESKDEWSVYQSIVNSSYWGENHE